MDFIDFTDFTDSLPDRPSQRRDDIVDQDGRAYDDRDADHGIDQGLAGFADFLFIAGGRKPLEPAPDEHHKEQGTDNGEDSADDAGDETGDGGVAAERIDEAVGSVFCGRRVQGRQNEKYCGSDPKSGYDLFCSKKFHTISR